jgi:hypothetical protein
MSQSHNAKEFSEAEDLEKGKISNMLTAGAMGLGLLHSTNVQANADHVGAYIDSMKDVPGVTIKKNPTNPDLTASNRDIHIGKFKVNVKAVGGGGPSFSHHEITLHGPKRESWTAQDSQDYENAKHMHSHLQQHAPKLMDMNQPLKRSEESLEKKCPRCGSASANKSNPSGRCRECLSKLKRAKKTPGHWQRAQTKADDALRRQDGKNGTAHKKSSGRGSRDSIVRQVKSAEKKTGQKLSPDRKNNGKGYEAANTRMVPEKLNRGRHKVDSKKLASWRKRLKKSGISLELLETALLAKTTNNPAMHSAIKKVLNKKYSHDKLHIVSSNINVFAKNSKDGGPGLSPGGVKFDHLDKMFNALSFHESPPSAHILVRHHRGEDMTPAKCEAVYDAVPQFASPGSSGLDPADNPDLFHDNEVRHHLNHMSPMQFNNLCRSMLGILHERWDDNHDEGDPDQRDQLMQHINNLTHIKNLSKALTKVSANAHEELSKASKKQLLQMLGDKASVPHHQKAVERIRNIFPNSNHDVWLTRHYRDNPEILQQHAATLEHLGNQMKIHNDLRLHDVSKMSLEDGIKSLTEKDRELTDKARASAASRFYLPKEGNQMFIRGPFNGNKNWYTTNMGGDPDLGEVCGHCGNGDGREGDTALYLASSHDAGEGRTGHKPTATFIINGGYLGEMKGNYNKKPSEDDHEAIAHFLLHPSVHGIIGGGFAPLENFQIRDLSPELREMVLKAKPHIDTLAVDHELDPSNFPEVHSDQIHLHNRATRVVKGHGGNADSIVDTFDPNSRDHTEELSAAVGHPKHGELFKERHLRQILDKVMAAASKR